MIKQIFIKRDTYQVDEGCMGFTDWVTKQENMEKFMEKVEEKANSLNGKVINISYLSEGAIIVYKEKK